MVDDENNKSQTPNPKQYQNSNTQKTKCYNLEERALKYAQQVSEYVRDLPKSISNIEHAKQLIRSVGSVGANYIEANEALSKKDFRMRIKISRKEAKESRFWLQLTNPLNGNEQKKRALINEAAELTKIFSAILLKSSMFNA
jgi:four helix bundle protein